MVNLFSDFIQYTYMFTVKIGVPSYGLAIIFITIIFKFLLYPLTVKQMKSMRAMQQLQPKLKEIQAKYKDKPEKSQQAIMELYKKHGVNPMAGCFPLLVQMPILIAFYRALLNLQYSNPAHAGFLWVSNLSEKDLIWMPLLAGISTFVMQKVTMTGTEPTQKSMLYIMPIFIAWITRSFPAGLALYWITFNIIGTLQQLYINRMPSGVRGEEVGK